MNEERKSRLQSEASENARWLAMCHSAHRKNKEFHSDCWWCIYEKYGEKGVRNEKSDNS